MLITGRWVNPIRCCLYKWLAHDDPLQMLVFVFPY